MIGQEQVIRRRFGAYTTTADGRQAKGTATDLVVVAVIQPATGRDLERLPEGLRASVSKMAMTQSSLRTVDQETGLPADYVIHDGETYEVANVQRWRQIMPHYQAALVKVATR